jgi:hypothetical protein
LQTGVQEVGGGNIVLSVTAEDFASETLHDNLVQDSLCFCSYLMEYQYEQKDDFFHYPCNTQLQYFSGFINFLKDSLPKVSFLQIEKDDVPGHPDASWYKTARGGLFMRGRVEAMKQRLCPDSFKGA